MRPFEQFPEHLGRGIRYLLTDIDDTLTTDGRLPAAAYQAMEDLAGSGIRVVPVTGRPAGWCDHIARMWPVAALVGENGAFYFAYDHPTKTMVRRYWKSEANRVADRAKLDGLRDDILRRIPECRVSADQAYREADLAIDFCEDVPPLAQDRIDEIVRIFENAGATAKISSIHVNGWFGAYDKLAMTRLLFQEVFRVDLEAIKETAVFTGDSPNDEPMFAFFPHGVGVANILEFEDGLEFPPAWVTRNRGGQGFAEVVQRLLTFRGPPTP